MPRRCAPPLPRRDAGFTLIELMVTLVITLLVLMAGLSFYLMSRSSYVTIDDNANLEERGNFAISIMTRLMRQTAYVPVVSDTGGMLSVTSAMLTGLDNCSTPNDSETLSCGPGTAVNGSDAVMIRYYGIGKSETQKNVPDGSVIDCSGQGVAGSTSNDTADTERGLSMLFIANGASGKPSLMCKYRTRAANGVEGTTFVTQELVPGVETMQLLYGVTTNGDDVPDKYVTADGMAATDWINVKTVKIALVVRADNLSADAGTPATISLFGPLYSGNNATFTPTTDTGSVRKLYYATVQIRNYQSCGDSSC